MFSEGMLPAFPMRFSYQSAIVLGILYEHFLVSQCPSSDMLATMNEGGSVSV